MAYTAPYSNMATPDMTPADVAERRKLAAALGQQGSDASPVGHWTQGLARVLMGGRAGYYDATASQGEKEGIASRGQFMADAMRNPSGAVASGIANSWTTDIAGNIGGKMIGQKIEQGAPDYALNMKFKQAQINNLNRREEPEIVRQLRAAGVDPQSDQGRSLIMNSIKGGDPISQAIGGAISQQFQPQQAPQSPIRPQSFAPQAGHGDPQLIQAQTAEAHSPPQQQQPMVDTPAGPMPANRAKLLGFGLAMQGKGEAGKMMNEAATAGNLGKEGQNEIDKKLIAASDNLTNLAAVRAQFKPEYQQIGTRIGAAWNANYEKLGGRLRPQDQKTLQEFAAYRSDAIDGFNTYIKSITGAAMTESEAQRIQAAFPKAGQSIFDGDSPTEFKSKLDTAYRKTAMAIARYNYAKQNGQDWQYIGLNQVESIIKQTGEQRSAEYRKMGVPEAEIVPRVRQDLKKQFGVNI